MQGGASMPNDAAVALAASAATVRAAADHSGALLAATRAPLAAIPPVPPASLPPIPPIPADADEDDVKRGLAAANRGFRGAGAGVGAGADAASADGGLGVGAEEEEEVACTGPALSSISPGSGGRCPSSAGSTSASRGASPEGSGSRAKREVRAIEAWVWRRWPDGKTYARRKTKGVSKCEPGTMERGTD